MVYRSEDEHVASLVSGTITKTERLIFGDRVLPVKFRQTAGKNGNGESRGQFVLCGDIENHRPTRYIVSIDGAYKYVADLSNQIRDYVVEPSDLVFVSHQFNFRFNIDLIILGIGAHEVRHRLRKEKIIGEFFTRENTSSNWYLSRLWYFLNEFFTREGIPADDLDSEWDATIVECLIMHHFRTRSYSESDTQKILMMTPTELLKVQPRLLT